MRVAQARFPPKFYGWFEGFNTADLKEMGRHC